jgi:hypothetical protein
MHASWLVPALTSVPAACCSRRASAHSPRCRHTLQSAAPSWNSAPHQCALGPELLSGQLAHRLMRRCSTAGRRDIENQHSNRYRA